VVYTKVMIARRALIHTFLAGLAGLLPAPVYAADDAPPASPGNKQDVQQAVWKSYYEGTRVWGYIDKHSITPGEPFNIMLSTGPSREKVRGRVEIFRIGHYRDGDRELVWSGECVEAIQEEVQMTASSMGAGWPIAVEDVKTDGWRSGYYTIDFIDGADGQRDLNVAYIVATNPARSGDILFQLSTNTYQAYNEWGGSSLYKSAFVGDRAQMVSFDRPTPPDFFEYEYYFVLWLEKVAAEYNLTIDYATNFDTYRDPTFAERCRLFISGSHNEYWSKEEFDAVYRRIFELGKNTMFLGANTAYWQVRYADIDLPVGGANRGRQLICYKSLDDPCRQRVDPKEGMLLVTAKFRDEARRPETMLMGVAYQSYFAAESDLKFPYLVSRTDLPFFEGVGYQKGDAIGNIVGYEWDNTDPNGDGKRLWDPEKSQIRQIDPVSIKVVFTGSPVDLDGKQGKAEAVYFVSEAGAKVFSTGSIRWAWGMGKPHFEEERFKKFNFNLLMHLLQ
jgi:N,N-dimethylformamidase beta subunit-like, C-terminal